MSSVRFQLDRKAAGEQILRGNKQLQDIQSRAFNSILMVVAAQFVQQFGFDGSFQLTGFTTDRSSVKISAADARTNAALKTQPGWMDQFTNNIVI